MAFWFRKRECPARGRSSAWWWGFAAGWLVICFSPELSARPELLDRVAAVVNDEAIAQSEVDTLLRPIYEEYRQEYTGQKLYQMLNDARQKLLNQIIEDRLVFQEAKKRSVEVNAAEVDRQIAEIRKRFPDEKSMEEALHDRGMNLTMMRERIRRQLMIRYLHDMEIRSKVIVSPLDVQTYYQEHLKDLTQKDQIRVRSITIKKSDEARLKGLTDEAARKQIEDLRKKIVAGEDFGKLAQKYSQDTRAEAGGLSEWLNKGTMIPVIDDVIFGMNSGEVSAIIETPMGYHVFRVEEKKAGHQPSIEEVRDEVFSRLVREKSSKRFEEWMEDLKRHAYISIR